MWLSLLLCSSTHAPYTSTSSESPWYISISATYLLPKGMAKGQTTLPCITAEKHFLHTLQTRLATLIFRSNFTVTLLEEAQLTQLKTFGRPCFLYLGRALGI